jgi:hypothetical protein
VLEAFVNRMLDQTSHTRRISQYLVSRYPSQGVSSFGKIPVAAFITLATFFGLMVIPVNLDDLHDYFVISNA